MVTLVSDEVIGNVIYSKQVEDIVVGGIGINSVSERKSRFYEPVVMILQGRSTLYSTVFF